MQIVQATPTTDKEEEAKITAKIATGRLLSQANMLLFEARNTLEPYANGCFTREVREIQERLRDCTAAVGRLA